MVASTRREPAPDDLQIRIDGFERVVRLREQPLVRHCCRVVSVCAELRHPEEVQVRLVADDDGADVGKLARQRGGVRSELGAGGLRQRRRRAQLVHGEHRLDVRRQGGPHCATERWQVSGGSRPWRPGGGEDIRAEAGRRGEPHRHGRIRRPFRRVLDRAELELRAVPAAACDSDEGAKGEDASHTRSSTLASRMASERVESQLKSVPSRPGVYLFRDVAGDVLYVGKAKSLRPRVRSYFQPGSSDTRQGIRTMANRVETVETIVTSSEVEALHLEQNLVKRHRPPFNVRLRDDKSFPYIAVTVEDDYPRVMFTRERHRRGVWYFGPYANAKKVRE